jgi:hypothetical protein
MAFALPLWLLPHDQDILEIIQFGSSVYAPKYAGDIDLPIVTKHKKDYSGYFNIANAEDASINIDVVVYEVGEKARRAS